MSVSMIPPMSGPLVDSLARDRARGVSHEARRGRLLIEAAAGSGKTSVLVDRVLSYVREGERTLDQMVVVTFTEAAAAELRLRLRRKLVEELAAVAVGEPLGGSVDGPLEGATTALESRWRAALRDLESARVGTIHALCFDLLRQAPIEAGVDPFFRVADELESRLDFLEAWEEFLRGVDGGEEGLEIASELDLLAESDLRRAALKIAELDPRRLPRPLAGPGERGRVLAEIGRALEQGLAGASNGSSLYKDLERFRGLLLGLERFEPEARIGRLLRAPRPKQGLGRQEEAGGKAARDRVVELLQELAHDRLARFAHWLSRVGEVKRRREESGSTLSFDQLIERTLALARDRPDVLEEFRRRHPIILIDEFQDTDRTQVELLALLAGSQDGEDGADLGADGGSDSGPRAFVVVGDPKQSIYRFRGADLETYRRLRDDWGEERRVTLQQTFRSVPEISTWVNRVMAEVFGLALEPYEAPFHAQEAFATGPSGEPRGVRRLVVPVELDSRTDAARAAEADAWAVLARRLIDGGPDFPAATVRDRDGVRAARYGDIALLLPKLTNDEVFEEAFARRGVPLRLVGGRRYYRREEIHALVRILAALTDPGDTIAALAALRGPGFGVSDRAIFTLQLTEPRTRLDRTRPLLAAEIASRAAATPDPDAARDALEALARLVELRALAIERPLPELVAEVLERSGITVYFALWERGEQRVANLERVVELARRIERSGRGSLRSFVRWLEQLADDEPREGEIGEVEEETDAVVLRTIHGAKGLEFPIVFVGGLAGSDRFSDEGVRWVASDPAAGGEGAGVELAARNLRTRGWEAATTREKAREEAEIKRRLYVALTRARDLLVIPELPGITRRVGLFERLATGSPWLDPASFASWDAATLAIDLAPAAPRLDLADLSALGRADELEIATAVRAAAIFHPARVAATLRPSALTEDLVAIGGTVATEEARTRARLLGQEVHRRLAVLFGAAAGAGSVGGASPEALDPALVTRVERLVTTFRDSPLAARASGASERLIEEVLAVLEGEQVVEGSIDLAFVENGRWILVDYKTDRLERADGARVREAAQRYRPQLAAYARLLERLTGREVGEAHLFFLHPGTDVTWTRGELGGQLE